MMNFDRFFICKMNRKESFSFYKWYVDLIDANSDDVCIIYMGEIRWFFVRICFTNILQFLSKINLISKATLSNYRPPIIDNNLLRIDTMNLTGQWESKSRSISEKLYENQNGYILWECLMPSTQGKLELNEKIYQGRGYIERLTMTIKPWQLPIRILHWGRFLSENHTIIWIRWQGDEEKFLIYHNQRKYIDGIIDDDRIEFKNYCLLLKDKSVLRQGPLIKTVFDEFTWIKRLFPSNVLYMNECKWQTWSELYENDRLISKDWSIHENVECKSNENLLGKMAYGCLFTIILPLVLIFWAKQTERFIFLPIPTDSWISLIFCFLGLMLIIEGMRELWVKGDGLPMNAYPPPKLVTTGIYRLFSHPIYIGSSILCLSFSVYCQSKSGFWFISPLFTFAWLALVYGYENEDLKKRFPNAHWRLLISVPENLPIQAQFIDRFSGYCFVLLPWLILYELVIFIGVSSNSISTYLPFEFAIPVIEWTELFYLLVYPYVVCLPLILQTKQQIRSFIITGLMNICIGIYLQLIFPLIAQPKEFIPTTFLGDILLHERDFDGPSGAFPSFHVSWAFISAYFYTGRFTQLKILFYLLSIFISISCITTGMHSLIDVVGGYVLFLVCIRKDDLWNYIRHSSEQLGNSWYSYRIGSLRIINHSYYAFMSAFVGFFLLCSLLQQMTIIFLVSSVSVLGGFIWAQWIEQSSGLSRPFGYFGSIIGGFISSIVASWYFSLPLVAILGSYALVVPWIQAIGRLRCIVQGCCHGRPTNKSLGISIHNPRSRICSLSKLTNVPIHNTAGYSILANVLIGLLLWRLWYSNVSIIFIVSLYFLLIGLSRFIEEHFRGEIQTPIYYRLKIYQWMSIGFVFIGFLISIYPFDEQIQLNFHGRIIYVMPSIGFACLVAFALGMDFPESKKRFSKLSD